MKLYVRISALSPFVLHLKDELLTQHYDEIAKKYYNELYDGCPPGPIHLHKIINLSGRDKLFEYYRQTKHVTNYCMEVQQRLHIYDEPPPCTESITMVKSPVPDLCEFDIPRIIGLNRLVLKLTDPLTANDFLMSAFWYNYRRFVKPPLFLKKLLERFDVPSSSDIRNRPSLFSEEFYYMVEVRRDIQHRVGQLLYHWVSKYYFDFDDNMVSDLHEFCSHRLIASGFKGLAEKILGQLKEGSRLYPWELATEEVKVEQQPPLAELSLFRTMEVRNIAEALTHEDYRLYKQIKFTELLDQSWNKEKLRHRAPNVMKNINFLNKVSSWVSYVILIQEDTDKRTKAIQKFIKLLSTLIDLNSLNMALAVQAGLNSSAIYRLTDAWEEVTENYTLRREAASKLLSSENNSKRMRELMNKVYAKSEPCSPYIGIYLRDLVYTEDGNPTYIDGRINFYKSITTHSLMHQILRFQERQYNIMAIKPLINEVEACSAMDQDKLYNLSLHVQPKK